MSAAASPGEELLPGRVDRVAPDAGRGIRLLCVEAVLAAVAFAALCAGVLSVASQSAEPDDGAYRASIVAMTEGHFLTLSTAQAETLARKLGDNPAAPPNQWVELSDGRYISEKDPGYPFLAAPFEALGIIRWASLFYGALACLGLFAGARCWLGRFGGVAAVGLYCSSGAALAFAWRDYMPTFTDASLVAAGSGMLLWAVLATQASHRRRTWAGLAAFAAIEIATFVRYTNIVILGCAVVAVIVAWRLRATDPALWRRLELASDLFLDQVHDIIQVAFGWTDSHLHRFASGSDLFGAQADHFLCPFDVDEGDTGIPEGHVRLDEVVAEPGDQLFYSYDYGDDWQHVIVLEAVLPPRAQGSGLAVCTDGRRRGPAEDCGGAHIYELVEAATGRGNARAADAADELAEIFGDDIDIEALVGTDYSPDEINGALDLDWGGARCPAASVRPRPLDLSVLPPPIYDLLGAVRTSPERRMLRRLIDCADLAAPVFVEAVVAAAMVRPYSWLLDRVGDAGIKLTAAGYLPPADVEAAVSELGLGKEWFGKGNRESQTLPVLDLREAAQRAGLLRKYSGRLQLSPRGRAARSDPVALWWRLAESLPDVKDDRERQAGLLLLLMLAAGETADWADMTAGLLTTIGWRTGYGESTTSSCAFHAAWSTHSVLRRVGALDSETLSYQADEPSREGIVFARAALLTWPADRSSN